MKERGKEKEIEKVKREKEKDRERQRQPFADVLKTQVFFREYFIEYLRRLLLERE